MNSQATWKVIAADMPIGLVVVYDVDRKWGIEAIAQGDGPARGRELEIATFSPSSNGRASVTHCG
jgi:alkaline phosphatase D